MTGMDRWVDGWMDGHGWQAVDVSTVFGPVGEAALKAAGRRSSGPVNGVDGLH
jgi:hypothetical protein